MKQNLVSKKPVSFSIRFFMSQFVLKLFSFSICLRHVGHNLFTLSQSLMLTRSNVCQHAKLTGSRITSCDMGHLNSSSSLSGSAKLEFLLISLIRVCSRLQTNKTLRGKFYFKGISLRTENIIMVIS